jgi:hypothetical protein
MAEAAPYISRSAGVGVVPGTSFVEWGAVLAGGAMAAALSFVLLTFGADRPFVRLPVGKCRRINQGCREPRCLLDHGPANRRCNGRRLRRRPDALALGSDHRA